MKKTFFCPALELFHCLPLWKTVLFVSSKAFSLSTLVENSEATWKKATKCNKANVSPGMKSSLILIYIVLPLEGCMHIA